MQPFIKKYTPNSLAQVVGQNTKAIQAFLDQFPKQKALIIYGPTGTGKTAAAQAAANDINYELFELNASDSRNKDQINQLLGNAIKQKPFFNEGKIILIDEIDGISGTYDRGGIPEIVNIIKQTSFPIIITCKNPFEKKLKPIQKISQLIEFPALSTEATTSILQNICDKEKITAEKEALQAIAIRAQGDSRAAINDLQLLGTETITKQQLDELSERSKVQTIEESLTTIFKTTDTELAIRAFDQVEEDVDQQFLWLDYNMPKEYKKLMDLNRAYGNLTKADAYRKRIQRRQHWRFLVYINTLLTAGIATAKDDPYKTAPNYKQSTRLLRIWQINMQQAKKKAIAEKIAQVTHASTKDVIKDFPLYKRIYQKNQFLELSKEENTFMLS